MELEVSMALNLSCYLLVSLLRSQMASVLSSKFSTISLQNCWSFTSFCSSLAFLSQTFLMRPSLASWFLLSLSSLPFDSTTMSVISLNKLLANSTTLALYGLGDSLVGN